MKKLSTKTAERIKLISAFLSGNSNTILMPDNDMTYIYALKKIYADACGIVLVGYEGSFVKIKKDRIQPEDFHYIWRKAKRDEDFKFFLSERLNYEAVVN